jgi:hypothetical protein
MRNMTIFSVINRLRLLSVPSIYLPTERCVQSLMDAKTDSEMEEWCVTYAKFVRGDQSGSKTGVSA